MLQPLKSSKEWREVQGETTEPVWLIKTAKQYGVAAVFQQPPENRPDANYGSCTFANDVRERSLRIKGLSASTNSRHSLDGALLCTVLCK